MSLRNINHVMEENLERKINALNAYSNEITNFKYIGAITEKKVKGKSYLYVLTNSNGVKKNSYLGRKEKVSAELIQIVEKEFKEYLKYKEIIKELKEDIKVMKEMMRCLQ